MRRSLILLALLSLSACSTTFDPKPCNTDDDCGTGLVCDLQNGTAVCLHPEDAPLTIGQSAPVSGTNQALGTDLKLGVLLAFNEQNAAGGIRGRQLVLDFKDDGYQPDLAEANAKTLVDAQNSSKMPRCPSTSAMIAGNDPISMTEIDRGSDAVLAVLGNVGTPTMVKSAPVVIETQTMFFGAFTGAGTVLRDTEAGDCAKWIFNVRASYAQEAEATMEYFVKLGVADYQHLISFDQNDSFGQAGYNGLLAAYQKNIGAFPKDADPTNPIVRFRYTRNDDTSVPAQAMAAEAYLAGLLTGNSDKQTIGVLMTDTYGAGATFIQALRDWQFANDAQQTQLQKATRLDLHFSNLSFVGADSLSGRLVSANAMKPAANMVPYTQDVVVSQVVPNYQSDTSDVVTAYKKLIAAQQDTPSFTSLEGYIDGRIFIAGLLAHKGPFTPDLISDFEGLGDIGLGIGATSGFTPTNHQYSQSVWGTIIQPDGTFKNLYFWADGIPISFFD